ncbi:hypothetical protein CAEBREN_15560 [Caenorhabditis brenneri]|uniref:Exonuclease domain-containing protein n=1 Tax=Caenorhabditis brenneri TaxID=135651 RepID=G0MEA2_CAEBE|nr:hypothetical protein CAEBREN_15560 [Caenorhabditis brenneri]
MSSTLVLVKKFLEADDALRSQGGLFDRIRDLIFDENQRMKHSFPVEVSYGTFVLPNEYQKDRNMYYGKNDCTRDCIRCRKAFQVDATGLQKRASKLVCQDHEGNAYPFHIHDQQPAENLQKFDRALTDSGKIKGGIFAIDVEMVYTSRGQSVGRVTMVNCTGKIVVDEIVKQEDEVFDPVTQFSGLTMEILKNASTTLDQVRQKILSLLDSHSVVVGHGLYGDLKALRIVHDLVIDTALIFSHNGRRPSLRHLTSDLLGRTIQDSASGHCSAEDALASLELMYYGVMHPETLNPDFCNFE